MRKLHRTLSQEVGKKKKKGENADAELAEVARLKKELEDVEASGEAKKNELDAKLNLIGNIVHESVPISKNEVKRVCIWTNGTKY